MNAHVVVASHADSPMQYFVQSYHAGIQHYCYYFEDKSLIVVVGEKA